MGFGVWGLGFGVWGFLVWGLGFGVWGLGFGVWGLGFGFFRLWRVYELFSGSRLKGLGLQNPSNMEPELYSPDPKPPNP